MKKMLVILLSLLIFPISSYAEKAQPEFIIKLGTLAPRGTLASQAVETLDNIFEFLKSRFGFRIMVQGYYGGAMGDDPQMIQKAQTGQLDVLGITITGLQLIFPEIEVFNMAFLIEDFGEFDYVMRKNSVFINNMLYQKGWIPLGLIISEGQHNLYLDKPYKNPDEMKRNIKAANYTGAPDDTFFKALSITQVPILTSEMFTSFKSGVSNAAILPSAFVIGMQIYTTLKCIVESPVRISTSAVILTKKKWDTLPWELKIHTAAMQSMLYMLGTGIMRDASQSYLNAMYNHGTKKIRLSKAELDEWKKYIFAYRDTYLGNDKNKKALFDNIYKATQEYRKSNPVEKQIYDKDPYRANFPDVLLKIDEALSSYAKTGSKAHLLKLTEEKLIEKWRFYDWIEACEIYINTGNHAKLKEWMRSFYISDVVDEIFTKHLDTVKKVYGSKKALNDRIEEFLVVFANNKNTYKGFQKMGVKSGLKSK